MNSNISIIIPVYNVEKFLPHCIESVISQSYQDWELLLIDDGSKDESGIICDRYAEKDSRIKVIHKTNGGVSSARNRGLDIATGNYVCFIDSDDWVGVNYLSDFKTDRYDADIYISGATYDTYGKPYSYKQYEDSYCKNIKEIDNCFVRQGLMDNGYPWGKLFRRDLLQTNSLRFNENMSINEDHVFVLEYMLLASSMLVTSSFDYHYTVFDKSGRKLSGRINRFDELKTASVTFDKILKDMEQKWRLDDSILKGWRSGYVYTKRLHGLRSMILLNDLSCFDEECRYWKNNTILLEDPKSRIILMLIRSSLPRMVKIVALRLFYKAVALMAMDIEKAIYRDVEGRSTKVIPHEFT